MLATVDALALRLALKRLKPRSRFRSMREPTIEITAGGDALVLVGTLETSASVAADITQAGSARIPLDAAIKLLSTYPKGSKVILRTEPSAIWFDKLRLPFSE